VTDTFAAFADPEFEKMRIDTMRVLLSEYGKIFQNVPTGTWRPKKDKLVRCYDNAMELMSEYSGLIYCEGILSLILRDGTMFEMPHGWCCDHGGRVIDPTSHATQYMDEATYFGIPIKYQYALDWHKKVGYHGLLDGAYDSTKIGIHYDPPELWLQEV
jgi:hypothetical protein